MTQESNREMNPESAVEARSGPNQTVEQAKDVTAINRALHEEMADEFQAPLEEKRIARVVSVAGSQVMMLLDNSEPNDKLEHLLAPIFSRERFADEFELDHAHFGLVGILSCSETGRPITNCRCR